MDRYLSYNRSLKDLDFMSEQLMEVLRETESSEMLQNDPSRIQEARKLLGMSEHEIEHLSDLESHEVKDYHVSSVKDGRQKDELIQQLFSDRTETQKETDDLEKTLGQMKDVRSRVQNVRDHFMDQAMRMAAEAEKMNELGMGADYNEQTIEKEVLPEMDRLLYKLDFTIEMFEKELEKRLEQLEYLGKQISWLRGGQATIKIQKDDGEELPPDADETPEQPTQAEALVDHQNEQMGEHDVADMDRGRSDERQKKKRGSRAKK